MLSYIVDVVQNMRLNQNMLEEQLKFLGLPKMKILNERLVYAIAI